MAWTMNGTPDTLASAGDTLSVSDMTAKKFNMILFHGLASGSLTTKINTQNDTGTNNFARIEAGNAADYTVSGSSAQVTGASVGDDFMVGFMFNILGEPTGYILQLGETNTTGGAATAPLKSNGVAKFVGGSTVSATNRLDIENTHSGNYDTNSNLTIMGTDNVTLHTTGSFTTRTLSGSHVQNAEGGFITYGVVNWGYDLTITSVRFQGTTTYGSAPKNGNARFRLLPSNTTVYTRSVPINQTNASFDSGTVSVANITATGLSFEIFQEGEGGSPTISVTSSTNTITSG